MPTQLTILGRVPSKKNSKRWIRRGSRMVLVPSEAHEAWEAFQLAELKGQAPLKPPYSIQAIFYAPDARSADASNKFESVADLLVKAGILTDDNWFDLAEVHLKFGGVDRKNPRVEIVIFEEGKSEIN